MSKFSKMTLGQKIRELREANGMFQRQLASILEIGDGFLSKIESDQKALKREHLKTLSKTFDSLNNPRNLSNAEVEEIKTLKTFFDQIFYTAETEIYERRVS